MDGTGDEPIRNVSLHALTRTVVRLLLDVLLPMLGLLLPFDVAEGFGRTINMRDAGIHT